MNQTILLVDDSATARALFKACIGEKNNFKIIEANECKDAINKAEKEKPFLIILDYNMPEMTGAEIAKSMQEKGIHAYYVLMSANTQNAVVDEVKELGFVDILEKPISADKVEAMLEKLS